MDPVDTTRVESESIRDFALVMQQDGRIQPRVPHNATPGRVRLDLDPDRLKNGLGQLVLTVVKLLHEVLERQALRRIEAGSLTEEQIERLGLTPDDVTHVFVSHHHLDHTVNIALFRQAEIVDFRTVRRDDHVEPHSGEGFKLAPNTTIWVTPGHSPQDASLIADTAEGRQAFTHLWWRSDRSPQVDPYSADQAELERNRQRLRVGVDVVIPGHGAPFRLR